MKAILTIFILIVWMSFTTFRDNDQMTTNSIKKQTNLFQLHEIDLHVHAGKERPLPLNEWIDLFVKDGRKVLLLLDHLELYRMDEKENKEWIAKNKLTDWYPNHETAKSDFMKNLSEASKRKDILIFKGWEIWEGELDEGLEKEPMKDAEVIGWHISKAAWDGKAPSGKEIVQRVKQILEIQKEFPVPMIIFHPFKGYFEQVRENALKSGRNASDIKKEEYRYFTPEQQKELIEILKGKSLYFEINRGWSALWDDPVIREAFTEDIRPLAEAGIKFTVSTDAHNTSSFKQSFEPEKYCNDLGITAENVNVIVKELLDIRTGKTKH